ncbi:MAG: DHH family phosphoesterase [Anaerorhabdus sp.]
MILKLKNMIEEFSIISIYRHINPDMDAIGSQFGLKMWLNKNYPDKKVIVCGNDNYGEYEMDEEKLEDISNSLAFVLDTSASDRVDGNYFDKAKCSVKIDHHPQIETFTNLEFVDTSKAATCQYVPIILDEIKNNSICSDAASFFYKGILTDTLSFKTTNTTKETFDVASKLISTGLDISKLSREVYDRPLAEYKFISFLRTKLQFFNSIGYAIIKVDEVKDFNISMNKARSHVAEFGNINELDVWCLFTQSDTDNNCYKGSIRSKHLNLIEIANKYTGGGHKNACGVKNLSIEDIDKLLKDIDQSLNKI